MQIKFPLLAAEDIDVRVNRIITCYGENSHGESVSYYKADLLLYKNARVDMYYLDSYIGADKWQRTHRAEGSDFICGISIKNDVGEWVTKEDVGEFSNVSANKGRASDAFKRAATNWGIGRELYSAPNIKLILKKHETYINQKTKNAALSNEVFFLVSEIEYDTKKRIITSIVIKDNAGNYRYAYPDSKRAEIQKRIETAQKVGELVEAAAKKPPQPLKEIIPVQTKRAEEVPPTPKPKNTPPPKADDTKIMCVACGVGISEAVAKISMHNVQQVVCIKCRQNLLKKGGK